MIKLLVLSCGTNANYHICKRLKECFKQDFFIIGADINDEWLLPTAFYLDRFYKIKPTRHESYLTDIENILKIERPNYILPTFDSDQQLFFNGSPTLSKYGCVSLSTPKETLSIYQTKLSMYNFLKENGFPLPEIFTAEECDDNTFYAVKPVNGVGSAGFQIKKGIEIKQGDLGGNIIQELCSNPEITVECFTYGGRFSAVCRERIAAKAGVCTKTHVFTNNGLKNIAKKFALLVRTPAIFNLQFMTDNCGRFVITDVNLRTAGGMSLSAAAGWDETTALAKIMLKKSADEVFESLPEYVTEQYVVRAYTDIVTKRCRPVVAFDLDGTLLDSRLRHKIVMEDVLKKFNLPIDLTEYLDFKVCGNSNVAFLKSHQISDDMAQQVQKEWISHIEDEKYLRHDKLYPDSVERLEKYAQNNDIALITARSDETAVKKQIMMLGIYKYFSKIYVVSPTSDVVLEKANKLKEVHACIMIGDTEVDSAAARLAGIDFLFYPNGFRSELKDNWRYHG